MTQYFATGTTRQRSGNGSPNFQPYDVFRARDGWLALGAVGPIFARVCGVIGADAAVCAPAATQVASPEGREFDRRLREWIGERTAAECVDAFNRARVPCCQVMNAESMAADPHYQARGVHQEWEDLQVGPVKGSGVAPRFSRTPGRIWRGSVPAGHDNELVYRGLLDVPDDELADLRQRGVI